MLGGRSRLRPWHETDPRTTDFNEYPWVPNLAGSSNFASADEREPNYGWDIAALRETETLWEDHDQQRLHEAERDMGIN
jgi:hypothetical protein